MTPEIAEHGSLSASPWVQRWSHLLAANATVLDVACGAGRHLEWFLRRGHAVTGIDRDISVAAQRVPHTTLIQADIENAPWPLVRGQQPQQFGAVVVTNYLWRALLPTLVASVAPGGVLLYETFAAGNETVGRPSRPDFLLQPGELLRACAGLQVVAYENGYLDQPPRFVQRIAAVHSPLPSFTPETSGALPGRYTL
ncbi:class I SAM-dependent methyltransferase [Rhodoferax saidenbachensis]|uniref:SAM-dependent methyltransferase n=1 Tax=Rhodoferax saidenbachensis TaxID=1484693 RepID=A0ABU1ZQL6_9BURK|nr:class I SAM-dependent methyltransferase [Rhodoferax saidenbachensis]MDR7307830.1 SAM-dependent methyltransferase [Rhodoferax saidenbachensis]